MSSKVILLAGAPIWSQLDWHEGQLMDEVIPEFQRLKGYPDAYIGTSQKQQASDLYQPRWRAVSSEGDVSRPTPRNGTSEDLAWTQEHSSRGSTFVRDFAVPDEVPLNASRVISETRGHSQRAQSLHDSALSLTVCEPRALEFYVDEGAEIESVRSGNTPVIHRRNEDNPLSSSQQYRLDGPSGRVVSDESQEEAYLDHSIAVYEYSQGDAILAQSEDGSFADFGSSVSQKESQSTFEESVDSIHSTQAVPSESTIAMPSDLITLDSLPKANDLQRLYPQTVTVNCIAACISKAASRTIRTKKSGHLMTLIELLVGDPSRKTLNITFWIRSSQPDSQSNFPFKKRNANETTLFEILSDVRNRDILLLKNVALTVWNDVVSGQTLHPSAKTATEVLILGRGGRRFEHLRYESGAMRMVSDVEGWIRSYLPAAYPDQIGKKPGRQVMASVAEEDDGGESRLPLPPDTPRG